MDIKIILHITLSSTTTEKKKNKKKEEEKAVEGQS